MTERLLTLILGSTVLIGIFAIAHFVADTLSKVRFP